MINITVFKHSWSQHPNIIAHHFSSILPILSGLEDKYPRFEKWLSNKVFPGLLSGERIIVKASYKKAIVGVCILKKTPTESKICTLLVDQRYRSGGVGSRLLSKSILTLQTAHPIITVSSHRVQILGPLLEKYDFKLYKAYHSYYIKGQTEYAFNGPLS